MGEKKNQYEASLDLDARDNVLRSQGILNIWKLPSSYTPPSSNYHFNNESESVTYSYKA